MASIIKVDTIKDTSDNTLLSTSSGNVSISNNLIVDTDTLYVDSTNNEVGIGTTSPDARLHIQATSATSGEDLIKLANGADACELIIDTSANEINFKTGTGDDLVFLPAGTEAMRLNDAGNLTVGSTSDAQNHIIQSSQGSVLTIISGGTVGGGIALQDANSTGNANRIRGEGNNLTFDTNNSEAMRINNFGYVGINQTNPTNLFMIQDGGNIGSSGEEGFAFAANGTMSAQADSSNFFINDSSSSAGTHNYIVFRYNGTSIGDIDTTDNSTIRYNTFTGGHWSQFHDGTNPELKKGTVMSLTGDKLEYSECEKTVTKDDGTEELQKFEIAGTHEIGSEVTVPNDEYGEEDSTTTATVVSNYNADHLVKVKVSDSVADKAVYGVWAGKYSDGDLSVEALGTSKIRIKQGEVLEVGDLLESAGDGTAQKQSDDIIKNSTIAKVTSPIAIETFDDNSFLVSCVLYCG